VDRATKHHKWEGWQSRLGTSALDPLQVMDMQEAIRKRRKSVIVQGKEFLLTYYGDNHVYYRPGDDSFAPAGHLNIKRFLED